MASIGPVSGESKRSQEAEKKSKESEEAVSKSAAEGLRQRVPDKDALLGLSIIARHATGDFQAVLGEIKKLPFAQAVYDLRGIVEGRMPALTQSLAWLKPERE
jgi:hypothetical protein